MLEIGSKTHFLISSKSSMHYVKKKKLSSSQPFGWFMGSDRGIDYLHRVDIERLAINRQFNNSGGLVTIG